MTHVPTFLSICFRVVLAAPLPLLVPMVVAPISTAAAQLRVEQRTVGDTAIVRTIGVEPATAVRTTTQGLMIGREDGPEEYVFGRLSGVYLGSNKSIYLFDQQVPILRQYDASGKFLRSFGRGGDGPGEYSPLIAAIVLPNGNLVLRDARANSARAMGAVQNRVYLYDSTGKYLSAWPPEAAAQRPALQTRTGVTRVAVGMSADSAGLIYIRSAVRFLPSVTSDPRAVEVLGWIRLTQEGAVRDTIIPPSLGVAVPPVIYSFTPLEHWAVSHNQDLIGARSDRL